jgi:nucleotide-binding universal stress UspA family protein
MYRNIMVPTDGSGFDREAILVALRIAERSNALVRLVRVLNASTYIGTGATPEGVVVSPETLRNEYEAQLSQLYALAAECRTLCSADISAELEQGPTADILAGYARRHDIDLIVISSHGRHGMARLALGSVTDWLIRGTTIPVLVVKPKASYLSPEASKEFHHVVVPLDGSVLAEQVLARAVTLAKLEEAEITLLHVLTPTEDIYEKGESPKLPWWEKKVAGAQAYLSRQAVAVRAQGVATTIDVVVGERVSEAITDYARREGADLIAIATHGRGGLARVLHGSVADGVTKSAMSSILVFHPDKTAKQKLTKESVEKSGEEAVAFA